MKALALWHVSATSSKLEPITIPEVSSGECLVESQYSLISTGTEKLVASGLVPEDMYATMKVPYMTGDFNFPFSYGYSLVGLVKEGPDAMIGQAVHLLHPHQNLLIANSQDLYLIPNGIPAKRAALASNLETAINAIWDSEIAIGDKVLLIGFGIIGALLAKVIASIPGIQLTILEKDESRMVVAKNFGFNIIDSTNGINGDFDIAYNCSANESGLQQCIDNTGYEGKIIEMSWYGNRSVNIQLGRHFHDQRKKIICSQVSQIPGYKTNRWNYKRRKDLVFDLLQDAAFDQIITNEITFNDAPDFFNHLRTPNSPTQLSTIIKY